MITGNRLVALAAGTIVWLSIAIIWINENGNPFRNEGPGAIEDAE